MQSRPVSTLRRLIHATRYSASGLASAFRHEAAFRLEMALSLVLVPLALWLGESAVERALLLASWGAVPLVELVNSAIEAAVDRIGPERHELAGRAKDLGSAAVFVSILLAAAVWGLVLWERFG